MCCFPFYFFSHRNILYICYYKKKIIWSAIVCHQTLGKIVSTWSVVSTKSVDSNFVFHKIKLHLQFLQSFNLLVRSLPFLPWQQNWLAVLFSLPSFRWYLIESFLVKFWTTFLEESLMRSCWTSWGWSSCPSMLWLWCRRKADSRSSCQRLASWDQRCCAWCWGSLRWNKL